MKTDRSVLMRKTFGDFIPKGFADWAWEGQSRCQAHCCVPASIVVGSCAVQNTYLL